MNGWQTVQLAEVAAIERTSVQPDQIKPGTAYIGLEHIENGGRLLGSGLVNAGDLASSKFRFTNQHVLYGKLRPYLGKIVCPEFGGICSTDILPILPGPKIHRRYLFHFLRQPSMVEYAASQAVGVNLPRLSPSGLANFQIPIPSVSEQRRIAGILDKADELLAKRRAVLSKLDSIAEAIFFDLFGNPRQNRTGWPTVPLGELCVKLVDGCHKTPTYLQSGVPFITVSNIVSGSLDFKQTKFISPDEHAILTKRVRPEHGDILVSKDGTIGVPCPIQTDREFSIFVSVALLKIKHDVVDQIFLTKQMQTDWVQSQIRAGTKGIAIRHLHLNDFKRLSILVPPLLQQKKFVRCIVAVEKAKAAQAASLSEMNALFASLQHRAFMGSL